MPNETMCRLGRVSTSMERAYGPFVKENGQFHDVGCATLSGNRYGSLNQDYGVVQEMYAALEIPTDGRQTYIMALCDGHGVLGEKAAVISGKAMVRTIFAGAFRNKNLSKMPQADMEAEMKSTFLKGHQAACTVYDNPPKTLELPKGCGSQIMHSYALVEDAGVLVYKCNGKGPEKLLEFGCTATVAVVQGQRLCLANVGDSQAVLGSCSEEGECSAEVVTERHWGRHEGEAARIREGHGQDTKMLEDGYLRVTAGPWAGYELSVTRALGHKNVQHNGVISEPYVTTRDLEKHHFCLILASDGVWDVMSPREAVIHVVESFQENKTAQQAAAALVQHAVELGLASPGGEQDNTSAIVMFL